MKYVICAECPHASIRGDYLYCEIAEKICYSAKPKWCPVDSEEMENEKTKVD